MLPAEQLGVFLLLQVVDLLDVAVGELLDLVEALLLVVLGDLWSLSSFFSRSLASRRTWRTPLRPSSLSLCTSFDSSFRRSSVSDGSGMRTTLPSLAGFSPRPGARIAFSIAAELRRVERLRDDQRRLGDRQAGDLIERHLRAVGLDVHAVENRDRRAARCARPANSCCTCSSAAFMRLLASAYRPFRSVTSIGHPPESISAFVLTPSRASRSARR